MNRLRKKEKEHAGQIAYKKVPTKKMKAIG
jgi:hypothetical protein